MRQTPLAKVGKKRAAQIAAGTYVKPPRKPLGKGKPKGRVKPVSDRRQSEQSAYQAWRRIALDRAGDACEWCGQFTSGIVHHLFEVGAYPELRLHPANGMALCSDECHREAHLDLAYTRGWWARLNAEFAALYAITPDRAAILHPTAARRAVGAPQGEGA